MKNFGKAEDWMACEGNIYCDNCAKSRQVKASHETTFDAEEELSVDYLCESCYEKHVVKPTSAAIKRETMFNFGKTEDWMPGEGWTLCGYCGYLSGVYFPVKHETTVEAADDLYFNCLCKDCYEKHVVKLENTSVTPAPTEGEWVSFKSRAEKRMEMPLEKTLTAIFEFRDGERIVIPPPEGDGWGKNVVEYDWPHRYLHNCPVSLGAGIRHKEGLVIWNEYRNKIYTEISRVVSITAYERVTFVQEKTESKTVHDARRTFPLLNGVE